MIRRTIALVVLVAALVVAARAFGMTNEDVVRRVAAGEAPSATVAAIAASEPEFDLDPEMVEELRRAGVSDVVLRAMRERQQAWDRVHRPPSPVPSPVPEPTAPPNLVVVFKPADVLRVAETIGLDAANALDVRAEPGRRKVADVAVWLVCTTAEHVPDQWRLKSPLGVAGRPLPRHEMLAFLAGAKHEKGKVELTLPATLSARLDPDGDKHDLMMGVALLVDGTWLPVGSGSLKGVGSGDEIQAAIRAPRAGVPAYEIILRVSARRVATPPAPPS